MKNDYADMSRDILMEKLSDELENTADRIVSLAQTISDYTIRIAESARIVAKETRLLKTSAENSGLANEKR